MDKSKMSPVERWLAALGVLAGVTSLLTWFSESASASVLGMTFSAGVVHDNGWQVGPLIWVFNLVLVMLAVRSVLPAFGMTTRHLSHFWHYTALTALVTVFVVLRLAIYPHPDGVSASPGIGQYLGIIEAAAATVICYLAASGKSIGRKSETAA
jgi:hypothetical protein